MYMWASALLRARGADMPTTVRGTIIAPVTEPTPWQPDEGPPWRPANDVETRLLAALDRDDRQEFFRTLMTAPLFLPQTVTDPDTATEARAEDYVTFDSGEVTYLLAFTSVETLEVCVGHIANGYVESDYDTLRVGLADSDLQLGFNLGTPIDAWLDPESVARAAAGEIAVPTGAEMAELMELTDPANAAAVDAAAEQELEAYVDDYITGLVDGDVLVVADRGTWRIAPVEGVPTIEVYSAAEHAPPGTPTTTAPFLDVVARWPAGAEQLTVNPGTPLAFSLPAEVLAAFAEQANLTSPENN
jgi:hypothetical protein